jgi:hypothetical protein
MADQDGFMQSFGATSLCMPRHQVDGDELCSILKEIQKLYPRLEEIFRISTHYSSS